MERGRGHKKWQNRGDRKGKGTKDFSHSIEKGREITGMLVTCSGKNEKAAVQDIYKILNRFAEEAVPGLEDENEQENLHKRAPEDETKPRPKKVKNFQQMKMNAKAMVFIIMNPGIAEKISAKDLGKVILDGIEKDKLFLSKYCSRLYPIEYAVDASLENFEKYATLLVAKYFPPLPEPETKTWSMRFKCRSNSKFNRSEFLSVLFKLIHPSYQFIQFKPEVELFVDITQHTMCLSVLSPYSDHKYYSIHKAFEQPTGPKTEQKTQTPEDGEMKHSPDQPEDLEEAEVSSRSDIDLI